MKFKYTRAERAEILPRQRQAVCRDIRNLKDCLDAEDWAGAHRAAVNIQWDATMIAGLTLENARASH